MASHRDLLHTPYISNFRERLPDRKRPLRLQGGSFSPGIHHLFLLLPFFKSQTMVLHTVASHLGRLRLRTFPSQLLAFLQLLLLSFLLLSEPAIARPQQDEKILSLLADDIVAAIFVANPAAIVDSFQEIVLSDDEWARLEALICNDEFGLLTRDEYLSVIESRNRLCDVFRQIESVSFIVHSFEERQLQFSLAIEATDEQCTTLIQEMGSLTDLLRDVKLFHENADLIEKTLGNLQRSKVDRFHVFHNRGGEPPISVAQPFPLLKSRSFRRGWNQLVETPWDMALYFAPRRATELAELYLDAHPANRASKERRVSLPDGYREIVSFCSSVDLSSGRDGSLALIRNFLCFTVPRSGITMEWEAYKALDHFPQLPIPVFEFKARNDTRGEKDGFGSSFDARFLVKTSDTTPPWRSALYLSEVKDHDAATRYVEYLQQNAKGLPPEMGMQKVEAEDGVYMAKETDEYAKQQAVDRLGFDRRYQALTADEVGHIVEYNRQTRFLDSKWHILGYAGGISDLFQDGEDACDDYGTFIERKIRETAVRTRPLSEHFAAEAYSPMSYTFPWMVHQYLWPKRSLDQEPATSRDVLAVWSERLGASFAHRYGTQLWIYSQNDSVMQIDVQVFQSPGQLFPEAVRKFGDDVFRQGYLR